MRGVDLNPRCALIPRKLLILRYAQTAQVAETAILSYTFEVAVAFMIKAVSARMVSRLPLAQINQCDVINNPYTPSTIFIHVTFVSASQLGSIGESRLRRCYAACRTGPSLATSRQVFAQRRHASAHLRMVSILGYLPHSAAQASQISAQTAQS